ncbi:MAG: glycosyltransferase family 4 protein [Candidatus Heimdallarchaeaceae archaeon]
MNIAFVTFEYPPFIIGGAGVYAEYLTKELAKLEHQVILFTPQSNKENCRTLNLKLKNLRIINVKIIDKLPFKALQFWIQLPRYIKKINKERKIDLIHINSISYWFLKKKLAKVPHIITVHHLVRDAIKNNNLNITSRIKDFSGENNFVIPFIEKRSIKFTDKIIAVSNFTKEQIIKTYNISANKIKVIYNGIFWDKYDKITEEDVKKLKQRFNIPKTPILLFVGRVDDPRKGLDLLLKSFKNILRNIDATLLIVGKEHDGRAKKLAESLNISQNVIFTGFVDVRTLKMCYKLCDVYVCPSRLEGFGLPILEAMALEKPIIATRTGAIPEIVKRGILVDVDDISGLTKSIYHVIQNKEFAKRLGKINADYAIKTYSWEKAAKATEQVYKELIG